MKQVLRFIVIGASVLAWCACDGDPPETDAGPGEVDAGPLPTDAGSDAGPDAGPACAGPPGLYEEGSCDVLAARVRSFTVRYTLWADDADKERFVFLPEGAEIDTSNPDHWVFPVGTRVWKTFSLDGVRLETRLLEKTSTGVGPSAWTMSAFAWNAAQDSVTDVTNMPLAQRENVLGTDHDIPSGDECVTCHSATADVLNGFSAIMLNHDMGGITLQTLIDESLLSDPIAVADAVAPGDAVTSEALGYLHANCAHCHRLAPTVGCDPAFDDCCPAGGSPRLACNTGLRMELRVADTTPESTLTYVTAVGVPIAQFFHPDAPCRIRPSHPENSLISLRIADRATSLQMPPLATEIVDGDGVATVNAWISSLPESSGTTCTP